MPAQSARSLSSRAASPAPAPTPLAPWCALVVRGFGAAGPEWGMGGGGEPRSPVHLPRSAFISARSPGVPTSGPGQV